MAMAKLGVYQFSEDTAEYNSITRSKKYGWVKQQILGSDPLLQFTGTKGESITLKGEIIPTYRGGLGQVEAMIAEADKGEPLPLVMIDTEKGKTTFNGKWVISDISETRTLLNGDGIPFKIKFKIKLERHSK